MLGIKSWMILLIFKTPCIFAVTNCLVKISEPRIIKDMISTQGHFCSIPVKVLNKENVTHYCDKLALIYEVDGLLEKLKFIRGSNNERDKNHLIEIYKSCIVYDDYNVLDTVSAYLQTENMSPIQILERVNNSLHKVDGFMADSTSSSECESYYKKNGHNNDNVNKGPPCACPSPTTPISSSATPQTSLSYLSEFVSSTYTTISSSVTSPLAEDMSSSYTEKLISPQKNSQGLESSPFVFIANSSELKPLTTIVDHSHADTTVQSGDYTDFSLTNPEFPMHSTEFINGIHEPSYVSISLNPSQTRTDPEQVNKDTSYTEGMYESVVPATVENPSLPTYTHIYGEFSTVMEPDEIQETTKSEFGKQNSKGSVFQNSLSMPSFETSSNSVTKVRRSLVNVDAISRTAVTTQAVSSLSTSTKDPNLLFLKSVHTKIPSNGMLLSNTEGTEPVSQRKVIVDTNFAWASSYHSSTMLTTKTELSRSSLDPEGHLPVSDVSYNPVLNAHKSYNVLPQQERDIAIDDRQNSFSGPNYGSNLLPIIATEQLEGGRKKDHNESNLQLIIIVILVVLVLLLLCGFLYYMHQYRVLKRRLNISCELDLAKNPGAVLPEEREPLPIIECDIV